MNTIPKYQFKIIPQDGGYVGYAMLNDEVVFTTPVCRDSVVASRSLTNFVSEKTKTNIPHRPMNPSFAPVPAMRVGSMTNPSPANNNAAAPRKCCGRG
jgi:hypothetical protein